MLTIKRSKNLILPHPQLPDIELNYGATPSEEMQFQQLEECHLILFLQVSHYVTGDGFGLPLFFAMSINPLLLQDLCVRFEFPHKATTTKSFLITVSLTISTRSIYEALIGSGRKLMKYTSKLRPMPMFVPRGSGVELSNF